MNMKNEEGKEEDWKGEVGEGEGGLDMEEKAVQ